MSTRRRFLVATTTASLALIAALSVATPVAAECSAWEHPRPSRISDFTGYAFMATVTEASDDVGPGIPGAAPFSWHVELAVERVYDGEVPDTVVTDGWGAGCASLRGDELREGDHLFISTTRLPRSERDPRWRGHSLVWREVDGGWRLDRDLFNVSGLFASLPPATRGLLSTSQLVARFTGDMPATSTVPDATGLLADVSPAWSWLLVPGLFGAAAFELRRRRGRPESTTRV